MDDVPKESTDILGDFYDKSFEGLPSKARMFVEEELLDTSGFRKSASLEDAQRAGSRKIQSKLSSVAD